MGRGYQCTHHLTSAEEDRVHAKKKTYGYRERDEAKRQIFVEQLAAKSQGQLVYVDEAGLDNREDYAYGWNERGERFHALKSGQRQGRVNMIAGLSNRQLIAPFTVEGARKSRRV